MYDTYHFGKFSYGDKRDKYEKLLPVILGSVKEAELLIDVGCGAGYMMDYYQRFGIKKIHLTGVDLSPTNIESLRASGIEGHCLDVVNLIGITSNMYNYTVCNGVIMCASDPFKAFSELVRITKPGGIMYLNVYNALHPYNYLVYKPTWPIRFVYYNITKKIVNIVYPFFKLLFQPMAYMALGEFVDDKTAKTLFMDLFITPRLHFFTKRTIRKYACLLGCTIDSFDYNRYGLMIAAKITVK
jgi:SAM-dependent methyltransferase